MEPNEQSTETNPQAGTPTADARRAKRDVGPTPNKIVVETNTAYDPWANVDKRPTELVGMEPGWDYRYQPMRDFPPDGAAADDWRNKMAAIGCEPCNGPRRKGPALPIFHPSQPTAEVWRRPLKFAEQKHLVQLARNIKSEWFFVHYKNHPSPGQVLPEELRVAMYDFHDKSKPADERPTRQEIDELVRELVVVHPGTPPPRRWQQRRAARSR